MLGWEFSALGPGRDELCLFLPVLGWGRICLSPPVGQTGETGTEWFGARATAGAAPGFVLSLSPQLSLLPSGFTLTASKLSCSADIRYQEVQITPNFAVLGTVTCFQSCWLPLGTEIPFPVWFFSKLLCVEKIGALSRASAGE